MRLRLVNTANARVFSLEPRGLSGWIVAIDGMPLDDPQPLRSFAMAPAQRVDLIVDVTAEDGEEAILLEHDRRGLLRVATFAVQGVTRQTVLTKPAPLPPNTVPALGSLDDARRADLIMSGGAMGGMRSAMLNGRLMEPRELAGEGKAWAFNGMADMNDAPLIEAVRGETIRIRMTNDTAWPHAMHLHGHHFRQIDDAGDIGPLRDTLLMTRGETVEIAFVADNPGDWLLHCHMLEHAAGGMMTWLRVA